MSSTNKTTHLRLNSWNGADKPQREDFNRDNVILDEAIHTHQADSTVHLTAQERGKWNAPYFLGTYFGDGAPTRTVAIDCDFEPRFGLVFAVSEPPGVSDFQNGTHYNYFALITPNGSTSGVTLRAKNLTVVQSSVPVSGCEYRSFNKTGTSYIFIVFR